MIHFEGDKSFPLAIGAASAKLADAGFLANSLPDTQVSEATPEKAIWKLKPKLSFITGSLNVELTRTEHQPGKSISFKVFAKGIGATSTVLTHLELAEAENGGTAVHWTGDIAEVTGLLKIVPKGLVEGSARKVIEDVWEAVAARLTSVSC
jgi:carbon monoxide dehydrogenase subunit G